MVDFPNPPQWLRGLASKIAASTTVPDAGAIVTGADGSIRVGDGVTQLKNLPVGGPAVASTYVPVPAQSKNVLTGGWHAGGFGVKADGSTDDTAAWANAVTAVGNAGGGRLYTTGGTTVTGEIDVPNNVEIVTGPFDVFKAKAGTTVMFRLNSGAAITGRGTLDGTAATATSGIVVQGDDVTIRDLTLTGIAGPYNITGTNRNRPTVRDVKIIGPSGMTGWAIFFQADSGSANPGDVDGPLITGCLIDLSNAPSATNSVGVYGSADNAYFIRRSRITDNIMKMVASPTTNGVHVTPRRAPGTVVSNNTFINGKMAVSVDQSDGSSVTGNQINSPSFAGVEVPCATNVSSRVTITGNTIKGGGLALYGVTLDTTTANGADHVTVSGNAITGLASAGRGVDVGTGATRTTVTGNTIDAPVNGHGVYVRPTAQYVAITGNIIDAAGNTTTNGITLDSISNATVIGNTINGTTSCGVRISGSSGTLDYLVIVGNSIAISAGSTVGVALSGAALGANCVFMNSDGASTGALLLAAPTTTQKSLVVRPPTGSSAVAFEVDKPGTTANAAFLVSSLGDATFNQGLKVGGIRGAGNQSAVLRIEGGGTNGPTLNVTQSGTSTFDVITIHDNTDTARSRFNYNGTFVTKVATAPVLADLADGEIALYTDGSGNLKVAQRVAGVLTIKTATLT